MPYIKNNPVFDQNMHPARVEPTQSATKSVAKKLALLSVTLLIASCSSKRMPPHAPAPAPAPAPVVAAPAPTAAPGLPLAANWADYRRRAAQLILAANPGASFEGPQPPQWHGIATVTISFNADGSVRNVDLMRRSSISPEVNAMAVEAVRRVPHFGPVSNLPQPWQFNETFLYNTDKRFQLDTIVANR